MTYMKQLVHDGTRCSYKDAYSICVRGECVVRIHFVRSYVRNVAQGDVPFTASEAEPD